MVQVAQRVSGFVMKSYQAQVQRLEGLEYSPSYSRSRESIVPSHRLRSRPTCHRDPADNSRHEDVCGTSTIRAADLEECPRCSAVIHPAWPSFPEHHPRGHSAIHVNHGNEGLSCSYKARPRRPRKNSSTSGRRIPAELFRQVPLVLLEEFHALRRQKRPCLLRGR